MPGPEPPAGPFPQRSENRESAFLGAQFPGRLATPQLGPRYLPLRRLQLRGRCRRLRLTRTPPHSPAPLRGGPVGGGKGSTGGGPWLGPPLLPAPGGRRSPPLRAGHGAWGWSWKDRAGEISGVLGGERAGGDPRGLGLGPFTSQPSYRGGRTRVGKVERLPGWGQRGPLLPSRGQAALEVLPLLRPRRDRGDWLCRSCPLSAPGITALRVTRRNPEP